MIFERASDRSFLGASAFLFVVSAATTIVWCGSMSAHGGMSMPGGWSMSMVWMRMPGQSWTASAASFLGMWLVMMLAMMLPALVPALWRDRQAVRSSGASHLGARTAMIGVAYFVVWMLFGMVLFPLGVALATVAMQRPLLARAVPVIAGVVVLIAGALQFSAWKARHLSCCREWPGAGSFRVDTRSAWRHGLRLGLHCVGCSAGMTAILLVLGVMDLRVMAAVTAAMTLERLAPSGERAARAIGVLTIGVGLFLIASPR